MGCRSRASLASDSASGGPGIARFWALGMEDLEDHDRERAVLVDPCRRSPSRRLWEQHTLRLETQLRESNVCRRDSESCSPDGSCLRPRAFLMDGGLFLDWTARRVCPKRRWGFHCLANRERRSSHSAESGMPPEREPRCRLSPAFRGCPDCAGSLPSLCH